MRLFLYFSFSCLLGFPCFSQSLNSTLTGNSPGFTLREGSAAEMLSNDVWRKKAKDKEGHDYLFDSWEREARVISIKGNELLLRNINFNIEENRFETETIDDSLFIFHNNKVKTVELMSGESFIKMTNPKTNVETFFEGLIISKKISFYKMSELLVAMGVLNPLTQESGPDVITRKAVYFYTKENLELIELDLKKKSILKHFSDKVKEINHFVKENRLNYGNEQDVIRILTYYNTLL